MKTIILGLFTCFLASSVVIGQESKMDPSQFLVRIERSQIDLSENGITANDCVLVLPDGHFHMERRLQLLPTPRASLQIYESILSDKQIRQLRNILDSPEIKALPRFVPFGVPGAVNLRLGFQAQISRYTEVQSVGYMDWKANVPVDSDEPAREALRQTQLEAKNVLEPLLK